MVWLDVNMFIIVAALKSQIIPLLSGMATVSDEDPTLKCHFKGHRDVVTAMQFHPNGTQLVSSSLDQTLMLWNFQQHHRAYRWINYSCMRHDQDQLITDKEYDTNWCRNMLQIQWGTRQITYDLWLTCYQTQIFFIFLFYLWQHNRHLTIFVDLEEVWTLLPKAHHQLLAPGFGIIGHRNLSGLRF